MKFVLALFLTLSISQADEMQRLDSIVQDITKLRMDYEACEEKSQATQVKFQDEKDRNNILLQELKESEDFSKKEMKYKNIIAKLKQKIDEQKKKIVKLSKNDNEFPALEMKEEYKESPKTVHSETSNSEIVVFQAKAFRLNKESDIYSDLGHTVIDKWEEGTSFTSDTKTKNMVKITGYFIDQIWRKAKKEMWVKHENATQR